MTGFEQAYLYTGIGLLLFGVAAGAIVLRVLDRLEAKHFRGRSKG